MWNGGSLCFGVVARAAVADCFTGGRSLIDRAQAARSCFFPQFFKAVSVRLLHQRFSSVGQRCRTSSPTLPHPNRKTTTLLKTTGSVFPHLAVSPRERSPRNRQVSRGHDDRLLPSRARAADGEVQLEKHPLRSSRYHISPRLAHDGSPPRGAVGDCGLPPQVHVAGGSELVHLQGHRSHRWGEDAGAGEGQLGSVRMAAFFCGGGGVRPRRGEDGEAIRAKYFPVRVKENRSGQEVVKCLRKGFSLSVASGHELNGFH